MAADAARDIAGNCTNHYDYVHIGNWEYHERVLSEDFASDDQQQPGDFRRHFHIRVPYRYPGCKLQLCYGDRPISVFGGADLCYHREFHFTASRRNILVVERRIPMAKKKMIGGSWRSRIFSGINAFILILITLITFYPLYYVAITSISNGMLVMQGKLIYIPLV